MKASMFLTAFLLTALAPALHAQDLKTESLAFTKAYQEANNRGDIEALSGMYTEQVTFIWGDGEDEKRTMTRAEVKESDVKKFAEFDDQMSIMQEKAESLPDGSIKATGTYSGVTTNKKTGEKGKYAAAYETIFRKENGQWKLAQLKSWNP